MVKSEVPNLIPEKSKTQYENTYKHFKDWCSFKNVDNVSEGAILAYFEDKRKAVKPSTLWSLYSMLKTTLHINENIDVRKFKKLVPYLKKKSMGHQPMKSKVFTQADINKFIMEADNENHLMMKIALIMGVSGACRRDELVKLTIDDIKDSNGELVVKVPNIRTNVPRIFKVTDSSYIQLYRDYLDLRPIRTSSRRLFLYYHKGKCANQVVGINTIGGIPCLIATYLHLPNAMAYTGHCFRKTSATIRADAEADMGPKHHRQRKYFNVAKIYIKDSIENKIDISEQISNSSVESQASFRSNPLQFPDKGTDDVVESNMLDVETGISSKHYTEWESFNVADNYIEDSIENKIDISKQISNSTVESRVTFGSTSLQFPDKKTDNIIENNILDVAEAAISPKHHREWKSNVAENYSEDSVENNIKISEQISNSTVESQATFGSTPHYFTINKKPNDLNENMLNVCVKEINIQNCSGCTFNINIVNNDN